MESRSFIMTRRSAAVVLAVIALLWVIDIRSLLRGSGHFSTTMPWHFAFLGKAAWAVDCFFCIWLIWVSISLLRMTGGTERLLAASFCLPMLLIPIKGLRIGLPLATFGYIAFASYTVALGAAIFIFRKTLLAHGD
jgi:hypothetical protein